MLKAKPAVLTYFDRFCCSLYLAPRNSFVWSGSRIRAVKLLSGVDINTVVCTVALRNEYAH